MDVVKPESYFSRNFLNWLGAFVILLTLGSTGVPSGPWIRDLSNYYNDIKIFDPLLWTVKNAQIQWSTISNDSKQLNLSNIVNKNLSDPLSSIQSATIATLPSAASENANRFLIMTPLLSGQTLGVSIIGVVNSEKLFREIFTKGLSNNYGVSIYQNGNRVFHSEDSIPDQKLIQKKIINTRGLTWEVDVWPT